MLFALYIKLLHIDLRATGREFAGKVCGAAQLARYVVCACGRGRRLTVRDLNLVSMQHMPWFFN